MTSSTITRKTTKISDYGSYVLGAVLVIVPFHALLTVFASTIFGHYDALKLWKEVVLLLLLPVAGWVFWKSSDLQKRLREGWLFWAMVVYVALHLLLGLMALAKGQVNAYAMLYAWIINLRPMLIFALAYV